MQVAARSNYQCQVSKKSSEGKKVSTSAHLFCAKSCSILRENTHHQLPNYWFAEILGPSINAKRDKIAPIDTLGLDTPLTLFQPSCSFPLKSSSLTLSSSLSPDLGLSRSIGPATATDAEEGQLRGAATATRSPTIPFRADAIAGGSGRGGWITAGS